MRACHPHPAATKPYCIQVSDDLPLLVRRAWTANATRWPRRAFLGGAAFVGRPGQQTLPLAVFVLHALQKKSKSGIATPKADIELIKRRLKQAIEISKSKE